MGRNCTSLSDCSASPGRRRIQHCRKRTAQKTFDIPAEDITIPTDEAAVARGEHLADILCTGCHAEDLSGKVFVDEPAIVTIHTANITGLAKTHTDADLIRAIRHAVDTDGRRLTIMPAEVFVNFSAEDLGAIITYLKSLPSVGEERPIPKLTFAGRILLASGGGRTDISGGSDRPQPTLS